MDHMVRRCYLSFSFIVAVKMLDLTNVDIYDECVHSKKMAMMMTIHEKLNPNLYIGESEDNPFHRRN